MKALVGAFNQEKALVGAFSVIVQPVVEPMENCDADDNHLSYQLSDVESAQLHQSLHLLPGEVVKVARAAGRVRHVRVGRGREELAHLWI